MTTNKRGEEVINPERGLNSEPSGHKTFGRNQRAKPTYTDYNVELTGRQQSRLKSRSDEVHQAQARLTKARGRLRTEERNFRQQARDHKFLLKSGIEPNPGPEADRLPVCYEANRITPYDWSSRIHLPHRGGSGVVTYYWRSARSSEALLRDCVWHTASVLTYATDSEQGRILCYQRSVHGAEVGYVNDSCFLVGTGVRPVEAQRDRVSAAMWPDVTQEGWLQAVLARWPGKQGGVRFRLAPWTFVHYRWNDEESHQRPPVHFWLPSQSEETSGLLQTLLVMAGIEPNPGPPLGPEVKSAPQSREAKVKRKAPAPARPKADPDATLVLKKGQVGWDDAVDIRKLREAAALCGKAATRDASRLPNAAAFSRFLFKHVRYEDFVTMRPPDRAALFFTRLKMWRPYCSAKDLYGEFGEEENQDDAAPSAPPMSAAELETPPVPGDEPGRPDATNQPNPDGSASLEAQLEAVVVDNVAEVKSPEEAPSAAKPDEGPVSSPAMEPVEARSAPAPEPKDEEFEKELQFAALRRRGLCTHEVRPASPPRNTATGPKTPPPSKPEEKKKEKDPEPPLDGHRMTVKEIARCAYKMAVDLRNPILATIALGGAREGTEEETPVLGADPSKPAEPRKKRRCLPARVGSGGFSLAEATCTYSRVTMKPDRRLVTCRNVTQVGDTMWVGRLRLRPKPWVKPVLIPVFLLLAVIFTWNAVQTFPTYAVLTWRSTKALNGFVDALTGSADGLVAVGDVIWAFGKCPLTFLVDVIHTAWHTSWSLLYAWLIYRLWLIWDSLEEHCVPFYPHAVSCVVSELELRPSSAYDSASLRARLRRLACMPAHDTHALKLLDGSEFVASCLAWDRDFSDAGWVMDVPASSPTPFAGAPPG